MNRVMRDAVHMMSLVNATHLIYEVRAHLNAHLAPILHICAYRVALQRAARARCYARLCI